MYTTINLSLLQSSAYVLQYANYCFEFNKVFRVILGCYFNANCTPLEARFYATSIIVKYQ